MASERDFELLDDYLRNRLSGEEKASFERRMEADSDLRSEYKLQQSLIEGIKRTRVAQLKATLNNVAVPSGTPQTSVVIKIATSLVVAGVVGTGIYFFLNSEDKEKMAQQQVVINEEKAAEKEPQPLREETKAEPDASTIAPSTSESSTVKKKEEIFTEKKNTKTPISTQDEVKEPAQRKLDVFDPTEDGESGRTSGKESDVKSGNATTKNTTIAVEIDNSNKKFNFHYQFKDDKLFLYGSFEKNLYEIMEFFGDDNKRTVFLFYKDNYYLLNEDNQKIKPLVPITDQTLIKKLKESRG